MPQKETRKSEESGNRGLAQPQQSGNGNGNSQHRNGISPEAVAARAYDIYEREGRIDGRDMDHWIRAEAELRAETSDSETPEMGNRAATVATPPIQTPARPQDAPRSMRQRQNKSATA